MNNKNEEVEINLFHIFGLLWQKVWIIVLSMILIGAILFSYSLFLITPLYKASAQMYVNNSNISIGGTSVSISSSELTAAKSLLEVYVIILKTRLTLERVIEELDLKYTYEQLNNMVSANSVNGTEIFEISVSSPDPAEAEKIVNKIVEILPDRISDVVDGSSVRLVDHAVLPTEKDSPNCTYYAIIGLLIGAILSCDVVILIDVLDNTVRGEEYLSQRYNIPVLAVVPDVYESKKHSYGKYYTSYGDSTSARE